MAPSARKGALRILGKGERVREVPVHTKLRAVLAGWLDGRPNCPGAKDIAALFLNQRGQRLGVKGAHDIITGISTCADLDEEITAHVLRHTFATTLVRVDVRAVRKWARGRYRPRASVYFVSETKGWNLRKAYKRRPDDPVTSRAEPSLDW